MKDEVFILDDRRCRMFQQGESHTALYWGVSDVLDESTLKTAQLLSRLLKKNPFSLIVFEASDWNRGFSPWPFSFSQDGESSPFSGEGQKTLEWLLNACIPQAEARFASPVSSRFIGGYSLSGLFSLWAFYESGVFSGAASCSGSLWYPGWAQYAQTHSSPEGGCVYLSLGIKEEKNHHPFMSLVGDETRRQSDLLRSDANVRLSTLVWHPGGHFTDVCRRIAEGFLWLYNTQFFETF